VDCTDAGNYALMHKVSFYDCHRAILVDSPNVATTLYCEYVDINGGMLEAVKVTSSVGGSKLHLDNAYLTHTSDSVGILAEGVGSEVVSASTHISGDGTHEVVGISLRDGATFSSDTLHI
jgi:hypothetical protein